MSPLKIERFLHFDIEERYKPVAREIVKLFKLKMDKPLILDVGSGPGGIARFLPEEINRERVVLCDIDKQTLKEGAKKTNAIPVMANASKLPFRKDSFSAVICVHALEHIPKGKIRDESLMEMNRVAKDRLLIEGPFGKNAEKLSRYFINTLKKIGRPLNPVALEHLTCGIPDMKIIFRYCKGCLIVEEKRNFWIEYIFLVIAHVPMWRYLNILLWLLYFNSWRNKPPFTEKFIILDKVQ